MQKPERSIYSPQDFLQWREGKGLILTPKFQRRGVWKPKARSYFIDTILREMPIPPIYIRIVQNPDTTGIVREVVDGQQRIASILDFIDGKFRLSKSLGGPWAGKTHDGLSTAEKNRIGSYSSHLGICQLAAGQFYASLGAAEAAMLNGRPFALWHDPGRVISRSQRFFTNGFHEVVISSNTARLADLAAVRHRIVHDQSDARQKFDQATMNFVGRRYAASRPGRFLRDWDQSVNPQRRWLETFGVELGQLARQIA